MEIDIGEKVFVIQRDDLFTEDRIACTMRSAILVVQRNIDTSTFF